MAITSDSAKRRLPAYLEVSQSLRERIETGQYAAGEWLPAERDLALEMKVSRPVVQAALKHLREEGVLTQQGPGHRSRVSAQPGVVDAQAIAGPKARTIVAIMSNGPGLVCGHNILHGINMALRETEAPYQLAIYDTDDAYRQPNPDASDPSWERKYLERVEQDGAAGVILFHSAGKETTPVISRILRQGIPVVMIDRYSEDIECDFVGTDNRSASKAVVEHLIELGHRRIGYVYGNERVSSVDERVAGYRAALEANGIRYAPELVTSAHLSAQAILEYFLQMGTPPTALVAVHDFAAFSLINKAEAMGLRVPEDLSITGFDDTEVYTPRAGMLTTVRQPFAEIGRRAADLILSRQSAPAQNAHRHVFLPGTLIIRRSSAAPQVVAKDLLT